MLSNSGNIFGSKGTWTFSHLIISRNGYNTVDFAHVFTYSQGMGTMSIEFFANRWTIEAVISMFFGLHLVYLYSVFVLLANIEAVDLLM